MIFTEGCNWLVLSEYGYEIYLFLASGHTISQALASYSRYLVFEVLAEIEAKRFVDSSRESVNNSSEVFIYLTNNCNLRCPYCYMFSGEKKVDELSFDQWKVVLDALYTAGITALTFSGGEPLMYQYFVEICEYAASLGFHICVLSNGILWTETLVNRLASLLDEVQISLDGYDEDSYKFVRGSNDFQKVMESISLLSNSNVPLSISVTPLYENLEEFSVHYYDFGRKLLDLYPELYIKFSFELIPGRDISVSDEMNSVYRKAIGKIVNDLYPEYYAENFYINLKEMKRIDGCGYGGVTIAADGNLFWCNRIFEQKTFGNVLSMGILEIQDMAMNIKKKVSVEHITPCSTCPIKFICGGGCRLRFKEVQEKNGSILYSTECDEAFRNSFYERMVLSNEYFYE